MAVMWISCFIIAITGVYGDYPFRNTTLTWDERVNDLVKRLTLEDIIFQMAKGGAGIHGGPAPAIPRLGIKPYSWNTECLRGDATAGKATGFPQSIGLAAAFWPTLAFEVAKATGVEVRAKYNDYTSKKMYGDHKGLSCFSPVINIMRHPLWGRNQETYGEDPYLTGVYAANFVQGLQGDGRYIPANAGCKHFDAYAGPENLPSSRFSFDAEETYGEDPYLSGQYAANFVRGLQGNHFRYVRANAGCKHFDVYGGPENIPVSRFAFDSKVSERDWYLTFLPAFRQCVLAGSYSLMCSFNKINGIPACANKKLLSDILRDNWGFHGYVISDEEAVENILLFHHYVKTRVEAVTAVIQAGLSIEITTNRKDPFFFSIADAVKQGKLTEDLVKERLKPLFYTRMRLGEFDPPEMNPYTYYNLSMVQSPEHRELAVMAAIKTFVLLKNSGHLLPLKKKFNKIAVVGPMADNLDQIYGDYAADPDPKYALTPLQGLKKMAKVVNYAAGCPDNHCQNYSSSDINKAVRGTQLTVICVGTGQEIEAEGNDRSSMNLSGKQEQLIKDAVAASAGSPIVLLIFSAGPVNITFADMDPHVDAIMQCFFPAQATGEALYHVLTLNRWDASPAGRLPYTWYKTETQIPSMTNYSMVGRTYRYFRGEPLYPFGYGLSYTHFQYLKLGLVPSIAAGEDQFVYGIVENTGDVDGDEVVQCYISWPSTNETMPQLQLAAFDRYTVKKANTVVFKFVIKAEQMAVWTDDKGYVIQTGKINIFVGGQQPNQTKNVGSNVLMKTFEITGSKILGKY